MDPRSLTEKLSDASPQFRKLNREVGDLERGHDQLRDRVAELDAALALQTGAR
jgi:hypothetical protein